MSYNTRKRPASDARQASQSRNVIRKESPCGKSLLGNTPSGLVDAYRLYPADVEFGAAERVALNARTQGGTTADWRGEFDWEWLKFNDNPTARNAENSQPQGAHFGLLSLPRDTGYSRVLDLVVDKRASLENRERVEIGFQKHVWTALLAIRISDLAFF
jgi:hypothetical protein